MLHNKLFWIVVVLMVIGGVGFFIAKKSQGKEQLVQDAISLLKQGDDRSRDCEAFDRLVELASESKAATLMIGEMYARGMCHPFDLGKSIDWFKKGNLPNDETGRALFQAAMWEIPADDNVGPYKEQLMSLLSKSKELGFKPAKAELDKIPADYAAVFNN